MRACARSLNNRKEENRFGQGAWLAGGGGPLSTFVTRAELRLFTLELPMCLRDERCRGNFLFAEEEGVMLVCVHLLTRTYTAWTAGQGAYGIFL
ncbi:MAG: hypothetical protein BJ554DRAFT_5443 [Olpidium bornovanus]|uniref:Uncharacterized protein n=1 Tax=Olpidium bornovanus TaxID=278681 RepID=A0A8H7ZZL5_9FUNG|nr:MAG: hypothetical protein BJ554DRAFT_5443 [Olpidium bornovanus]